MNCLRSLNEEQIAAATHPVGKPSILLASAGAGKTKTVQARTEWLIENGQRARRICVVTFTNKAAKEIRERVQKALPHLSEADLPRLTTIHSLALSMVRKNPAAFGLQPKISLLDEYDQKQLLKQIVQREKSLSEVNPFQVIETIEYHRARGIGFPGQYTEDIHRQATKAYGGARALGEKEVALWELFAKEKRATNAIDFSDIIHLVLRRLTEDAPWADAVGRVFDHVLVDEAQDTSKSLWQMVNGIVGPQNGNLMLVGDEKQCQPPDTKVLCLRYTGKTGRHGTAGEPYEKLISEISPDDHVMSYTMADQRTYGFPRKVQVAHRPYSGPLLTFHTEGGKKTRVTPNHWMIARLSQTKAKGKYMLYLMQRDDLGYRIGMSVIKRGRGNYRQGLGLSGRMRTEKAQRAWILRVFDTRPEAEAWEEIYSLKYGIPESIFNPNHACINKNEELVRLVFSHADPRNAERCLRDHGLDPEHPFLDHSRYHLNPEEGRRAKHWRGYARIRANNCAPLAPLLDFPVQGANKYASVTHVTEEHYEGEVYSLDVEKDHNYIADGLVVGNSIYSFSGASPQILLDFMQQWREHNPALYQLVRNHRSVPEVVNFANRIQAKMATPSLKMESYRGTLGERGKVRLVQETTPQRLMESLAREIVRDGNYRDYAILMRTGTQLREIEGELIRARIPYIVRGGKGILQTEEVRDILAYVRVAMNPKDFAALTRAMGAPKRGIGEKKLEALREKANASFSGDLVAACLTSGIAALEAFGRVIRAIAKHSDNPARAIDDAIAMSMYLAHVRKKYASEPNRIETKEENLNRLKEMVEGIMEDTELTAEDLIFQMTMDRPEEDTPEGKVLVSSIHVAKGLEYRKVILWGVVEGQLPHWRCASEEEIAEERRVLYVGVTRARDELTVCVPQTYQHGEGLKRTDPSRFLQELGIV